MYVVFQNILTLVLSLLLIIGIVGSFQENLRKLLIYTIIGQLTYISVVVFHTATLKEPEFLRISFFYIFLNTLAYLAFFISVLYMKRGGDTYKVKSIYDLAQLWITDRKIAISFLILLIIISGVPFFPGFMCKWFFVEEIFFFNKYLGILSFFMSAFNSIPYFRIINQMIFNKNLMYNPKGPRWFFDKVLSKYQLIFLVMTTLLCSLLTLNSSILWYFSYYLVSLCFIF